MEQSMKTKLTSYQQGSPANLSPKQGSVRELVMNVRFGHKFAEFYGKQNPNGSWAKTCQDSLQLMEDNTSGKSSMTWPKLGIALDGLCTGQKTLVLFTEGTESSSLPTPSAQEPGWVNLEPVDKHGNPPKTCTERWYCKKTGRLLQKGVMQAVSLPTPTAFDAHNIPIRNGHNLDRGGRHNVGLKDMIPVFADHLLPTPRASQDHKPIRPLAPSEANGTHGKTLVADIGSQLLPTPTASEQKYRLKGNSQQSKCLEAKARRGELINSSLEETGSNGESPLRLGLNPEFVEAMMGFPIGWTDLSP